MAKKKPVDKMSSKPPAGKAQLQKLDPPTSGRARLVVFNEFERRIHDPYLLDAIRQFTRFLDDLRKSDDEARITDDIYDLCELSRAITVRLTPFSAEAKDILVHAKKSYLEALAILNTKRVGEDVRRYAGNIK